MDDLLSKLSIADKPQFTEISPELRSERKIGSGGFGTVFKESRNNAEVFTEKSKISPPDLQSERKIGIGSFGSVFKESLNTTGIFTEISPSELQLKSKIGSGGFGMVFKGSWNKTEVAIKVFKLEGNITPRQAAIQKEVETWAKLRHPRVLQFLGADINGEVPFIVMPYLENGNARDFVERHPECNRNKILHDVTLALVYLHGRNVVHGDIKGFNVLIDDARNAVLCDFGIASIKDDVLSTSLNSRERSISGTQSFMPPERLKGGSLRKPCDVYAFGMLIFEVHANANPLNLHVGYSEFVKLVAIEGYRPERPDRDEAPQMTDDIWDLAERCWAGTVSARPSIDDVCDSIAPSDRDNAPQMTDCHPPNSIGGSLSTHVPTPPPSAYDRLQAGATFQETFFIPCKYLWAITMTHDGKIIASSGGGSGSGSIQTWESTSGALRTSIQGHRQYVTCLAFFRNGSLVSGSLDKTVRVWDLESSAVVILKHSGPVASISLSTDNKTIASTSGSYERYVRLWDATTGHLMHTLDNPDCTDILSVSVSSDASFLVTFGYDLQRVGNCWVASRWNRGLDGQYVIDVSYECPFRDGFRSSNSCSSNGPRFALSKNNRLVIYDLHGNKTHVAGGGGVVSFSPDGNWLTGTADHGTGRLALKVWDAVNGKMLSESLHPALETSVKEVFVSHDGSTILAGCDGSLRVFVLTDR